MIHRFYQLHADNCALNLQQLKGYDTTLMKYSSKFLQILMQIPSKRPRRARKKRPGRRPPDCTRLIILQVITVIMQKICTLKKVQFLVAMCNMMHFSTVSTSRLKHFQLTQCAAVSAKPRCLVTWLAAGAG